MLDEGITCTGIALNVGLQRKKEVEILTGICVKKSSCCEMYIWKKRKPGVCDSWVCGLFMVDWMGRQVGISSSNIIIAVVVVPVA